MIYSVKVGYFRRSNGDRYATELVSRARFVVSSKEEADVIERQISSPRYKGDPEMQVRTTIEVRIGQQWMDAHEGTLRSMLDDIQRALSENREPSNLGRILSRAIDDDVYAPSPKVGASDDED